jgi:hypothetical protein
MHHYYLVSTMRYSNGPWSSQKIKADASILTRVLAHFGFQILNKVPSLTSINREDLDIQTILR